MANFRHPFWCPMCGQVHADAECPPMEPRVLRGLRSIVPPDLLILDDVSSAEPMSQDDLAWWDQQIAVRAQGRIVTCGFTLPADVADQFEAGDLLGALRYAIDNGLV